MKRALLLLVATAFLSGPALALVAYDDASDPAYGDGWDDLDNGGFGWTDWSIGTPTADEGDLIESSTINGNGDGNGDGDIDTDGVAWELYAKDGASHQTSRRLLDPLAVGESFGFDMDASFSDGTEASFSLFSPAGSRFAFFSAGASDHYLIVDADGTFETSVTANDGGVHVDVEITGANSYRAVISPRVGTGQIVSGTLNNTGGIDLFIPRIIAAAGSGLRRMFVNRISIPEPGAIESECAALAGIGALLCARRGGDPK